MSAGKRHLRRPQRPERIIGADGRRAIAEVAHVKAVQGGGPAVEEHVTLAALARHDAGEEHNRVAAAPMQLLKSPHRGHPLGPTRLVLNCLDHPWVERWLIGT